MITHLFQPFGRNGGELRVAAIDQTAEQRHVPDVDKELAGNGVGKVAVRLFNQQQIAELAFIAAEGQRVFVAVTVQFGGVAEKIARLSQQIETDIGQRQVDFQLRCVAAPCA